MNVTGTGDEERTLILEPLIPSTLYSFQMVAINTDDLEGPVLAFDVTMQPVDGEFQ